MGTFKVYIATIMKSISFVLLVLAISSVRSASIRVGDIFGVCPLDPPKPPTVPDFNVTEYLGNWYQYEGLPAFFAPSGTSCIRATYGNNDDGTVSVRNVDLIQMENTNKFVDMLKE